MLLPKKLIYQENIITKCAFSRIFYNFSYPYFYGTLRILTKKISKIQRKNVITKNIYAPKVTILRTRINISGAFS